MKKIILFALLIGLSGFFGVLSANAQGPVIPQVLPSVGPPSITGWVQILITVVQWFYTIVLIVAVLFILLAAFNFITSRGDPGKVTEAKKQLLYAIIGIAVALLSYGVVTLVQNSLARGLTY